jgi:transcriptional regulator with PAS, ATPase and Fis domain
MPRQRKAAGGLMHAFEDSPRPVYLIDEHRTIVYCNAACAAWVAIAADELVGQQCLYQAPSAERDPAAAAARLCPPPEALQSDASTAIVSAACSDGRLVFRRAEFLRLSDSPDSGPLMVILTANDADPAEDSPVAHSNMAGGHAELLRLRHQLAGRYGLDRLLGTSSAAARIRAQVQLASAAPANVLIVGPSGSGKQHVARAIHYRERVESSGALVPVACSVLDGETLLSTVESQLAKASATRGEPATLLLVDVDQVPLELQPQLARLLKGSAVPRVIALSCRTREELAEPTHFHPDLYCLLSTLSIELAPLARRLDDLPLLAQMFLEEVNAAGGRQLSGVTVEAIDALAAYPWPGNLDELAEVIRAAHAQATGTAIGPRDLPKRIHLAADAARWSRRPDEPIDLVQVLERIEGELINRALDHAKGNKSRAAELLGLTRPRLYRRLVQLGLVSDDGQVQFEELE